MYTSCRNKKWTTFYIDQGSNSFLGCSKFKSYFPRNDKPVFDVLPSTNNDIILKSSKMKSVNAHSTFRNMNPCIIAQ